MADPADDVTQDLGDVTKQNDLDAVILGALQNAKPSAGTPVPNLQELIDKFRRLPTPRSTSLERIQYFGDYLLLAELGRGGMGIVYRARQVSLNRDVALKMLLANQFTAGELLTRFRLEAEAAATLDHPHIVPVYEVGEYDKQPYYCMKFIEGTNLAESKLEWQVNATELTRSARQARSRRVAGLVEKLARAMHYAHQRGILHRDLKPSNILLDTAGEPHITDFGLAKLLDAPTEVTITGAVLGTPSYMAPEQAAGSKVITTAVDVYGLGAVLYELLTGRAPFKGESSAQTLRLVLETEPKPPRAFVPDIDRDLESICLKCIAREKNDRYASADALASDLLRYLRSESTLARPSNWRERAWKWSRRNPSIAALIASSLLAVMIFIIGLTASNIIISRAQAATKVALGHQQQANYIKTVSLAHRDLQEGDPTRALDMLASCDPQRRDWEWNYLKRSAEANYRQISHPAVNCLDVAFSPNSKYLAALLCKTPKGAAKPQYVDVEVALFDADTYKLQRTLAASGVALDGPNEIQDWWRPRLRISNGGHFIAFYGTLPEGDKLHGAVRCFDGTKDWQPMKLKADVFRDQVVMGIFFDKNRLYALVHELKEVNDRDTPIEFRVVDVLSGDVKFKFTDSNRQSSPQLNRDSSVLVLAGGPQNVLDFKTGEALPFGELRQTWRYISNMVISSDDKYIASVDNYGRVYIFDYATRKKLREVEAHLDGAYDLAFTGLNKELVTVGGDGAIKHWRISDGELLGRLNIGDPLYEVAVHPKTGEVVTPVNVGTLAVWNPSEADALQPRNPRDGGYFTKQLTFSGDGSRVFALESAMHLTAWDVATKNRIWAIEFHKYGVADPDKPDVLGIAPTKDGKLVAIQRGSFDNPQYIAPLEVWDVDEGKLVSQMPLTSSALAGGLVWDQDEEILTASLRDRSLVGFDSKTKQQIWKVNNDYAAWIGRHPRSGSLYVVEWGSATAPTRVRILDMRTGKEVRQLTINLADLSGRRFSFDGNFLLASVYGTAENGFRSEVVLINPETGEIVEKFSLGSKPEFINDLYLSGDGRRLFVQTGKLEVRIWDRHAHELILSMRDPHVSCDKFVLAPDGLAAVGTTTGRGFYLWDGRPLTSSNSDAGKAAQRQAK